MRAAGLGEARRLARVLVAAGALLAAVVGSAGAQPSLRLRMLAAEDARAATPEALSPIHEGLASADAATRRIAVRALGRMERPSLAPTIAPLLADRDADVRVEAADALAQAVRNGSADAVVPTLTGRLAVETHPLVRGAIATSLGRLALADADAVRSAERTVDAIGWPGGVAASPAILVGALRGLESLARKHSATAPLPEVTLERVRATLTRIAQRPPSSVAAMDARIATLAMAVIVSAKAATPPTLDRALRATIPQVRRLAAQAAAARPETRALAERALTDVAPMVRYEALAALGRSEAGVSCAQARGAATDTSMHVRLLAIDLQGQRCAGDAGAASALAALAGAVPGAGAWHPRAHAVVALSRLDPGAALPLVRASSTDAVWQVRMYAARAAAILRARDVLDRLAGDADANVAEAALAGLIDLAGHDADGAYLAALSRDDHQLLLAAARGLDGTPRREEAARALFDRLEKLTAGARENSRDARQALLERLSQVGSAEYAERLAPWLADFDPQIAGTAAATIAKWTGSTVGPTPRPLPRLPLPTDEDLRVMAGVTAVFTMANGGRFAVRLLPDEAPLNAWRFVRLARRRYFDGLTFHRVVPNFVIQGGSPGANEYMGDDLFSRDEVGLRSNLRGTLGISTRGRDTGDAQIFVNLVDNVRLDHDYTVWAEVTDGLEVVDAVIEGDVIASIELKDATAR